jgi:hypothetical protein
MEMMNRAIEGASDFREMLRKLQDTQREDFARLMSERPAKAPPALRKPIPPKRPGENRRDYRARVLSAQKAEA